MAFFEQLSYTVRSIDLQMLLFSLMWVDTWRDKPIETMKADMGKIADVYLRDEPLQQEVHQLMEKCDSYKKLGLQ